MTGKTVVRKNGPNVTVKVDGLHRQADGTDYRRDNGQAPPDQRHSTY
jgi:hypothetical protein